MDHLTQALVRALYLASQLGTAFDQAGYDVIGHTLSVWKTTESF